MRIAIDVMGGDLGIEAIVFGVKKYIETHSNDGIFFDLFGNKKNIELLCKQISLSHDCYEIYDTEDNVIASDMRPSTALKNSKGSSMFEAILHVAEKKADVVVSSGNTGAYMSISKRLLKMIDGIERPAIMSAIPTSIGFCLMLDIGANSECLAKNLIQFAFMGAASAKILMSNKRPTVGLLNIGTEKGKGTAVLNEAFAFLEKCEEINFIGFVEGSDISKGKTDVVVADGFSGNIALKTIEGTVRYVAELLKKEIKSSLWTKLFYFLGRKMFMNIKNILDPRLYNGASFVGLSSIAIKSHGNADGIGFANAIFVAVELAKSDFLTKIREEILYLKTKMDCGDIVKTK